MKVAVITDVHANADALTAVLADIALEGVEEIWCLGDTVGYGAKPKEALALVRAHCQVVLSGNHDLAAIGHLSLREFSNNAARAAAWTAKVLGEEDKEYLASLQTSGSRAGLSYAHASSFDPVWEYVLGSETAERCMDYALHRVCLVGHSHVPLFFRRNSKDEIDGEVVKEGTTIVLSEDGDINNWVVNPGSVGQPRDGDPRAAWMTLDTETREAVWHRTAYDIEAAQKAIYEANGLPNTLGHRLLEGQ